MKTIPTLFRGPLTLALVASFMLIPATTFAKSNNANQNPTPANGCPSNALGHLFAPGWLKRNTAANVPLGCYLPAGIAKKLGLYVPPAPNIDTVAPTISSIVAVPAVTTATVTWMTNEPADSAVYFGASLPVNTNASATQVSSSSTKLTTHSMTLTGLTASTTYYAVIRSRDAAGNTTLSSTISFTTTTNADVTAPVMTNLITVVGTSSLKFTWNTSEPATSKIFYSTTTPVNVTSTTTPFVQNLALATSHSVTLTGLGTSTLYRIVIQSKDASANLSSSAEFPVTTSQ
jgi:hypothetical protein